MAEETPRPSDVQLIAPALLQLTRASDRSSLPNEQPPPPCVSPACGAPITSFPDCVECRSSTSLNLQCDSCWTDCASPCEDDDCHIPQPCYDEHCAVESCVDSACAAESCTDVTCPETLHCNATCFDTSCLYDFGDDLASYDSLSCGQGHCFGFLPPGPTLDAFGNATGNDGGLYQCPQASSANPTSPWGAFGMLDQPNFPQEHLDQNGRQKRRRVEDTGYSDTSGLQDDCWSGTHFEGVFSPEAFDMALNHALPTHQTMPSPFDFGCQGTCHHQLKRNMDDWADDIANGLPCQISHEKCSHPPTKRRHKRSAIKPKIIPALDMADLTQSEPTTASTSSQEIQQDADLDLTCQWVTDTSTGTICGHLFTSAKDLDDHLQQAHTSKLTASSFTCRWAGCDTPFKHRGKLNRHISGAHSKYHAHVCRHIDPSTHEPCGRTFCTKEQLKNHETTHTGERRYKCSFCGHSSATKTQHNTHERIHTKEKPYACPWCAHRSGDSSNLSKHVRNKHPGMAGRTKKSASVEAVGIFGM